MTDIKKKKKTLAFRPCLLHRVSDAHIIIYIAGTYVYNSGYSRRGILYRIYGRSIDCELQTAHASYRVISANEVPTRYVVMLQ